MCWLHTSRAHCISVATLGSHSCSGAARCCNNGVRTRAVRVTTRWHAWMRRQERERRRRLLVESVVVDWSIYSSLHASVSMWYPISAMYIVFFGYYEGYDGYDVYDYRDSHRHCRYYVSL